MIENVVEGRVLIRRRGADRVRRGHLWVYRSDILDSQSAEPGAIVEVREERGAAVGTAFYSSRSQISLRFLTRGHAALHPDFIRDRVLRADRLRSTLGIDPRLSRRVYSEGDLLPGLIVDRYADCLVVQSLTQGIDRLQPIITSVLQEQYQPRSILFRNDSKIREFEGLPLVQEVVGETLPDRITVDEDGKKVVVAVRSGQKTGAYLDQRANRQAARRYAHGRVLDAFSYGGGFALSVADLAEHVEAVDVSIDAVELARSNVEQNNVNNVRCIEANAFDYLRQQFDEGAQYDMIILDPPAFAKHKESLVNAMRGYKEINLRAMRLLREGGVLMTCSCSHHVSEAMFAEMLAEAANDSGRWVRVLERRTQSPDHPILLTVPETLYLKCFVLEIVY